MPERKYEHAPPRNKGENLIDYCNRIGAQRGTLKPSHIKRRAEKAEAKMLAEKQEATLLADQPVPDEVHSESVPDPEV
tara:strand:+ start:593 stop:826 length:234 start_codon:yes stop_codon:yes gene_type:complete